jgi:hypothetical protein
MAAAHALHYQVGIPVRKMPLVLALLTGMELTQEAITQACSCIRDLIRGRTACTTRIEPAAI